MVKCGQSHGEEQNLLSTSSEEAAIKLLFVSTHEHIYLGWKNQFHFMENVNRKEICRNFPLATVGRQLEINF